MSRVNDSQVLEIRPVGLEDHPEALAGLLRVTTWSGHRKDTNTYKFLARSLWVIDDEKKQLTLREFVRLEDDIAVLGPLPDQHKRLARAWARERWGCSQYRRLVIP